MSVIIFVNVFHCTPAWNITWPTDDNWYLFLFYEK